MSSKDGSTASSSRPGVRGAALAAETISAAVFLGVAGAVYAWGFDGLAYTLGLGAGLLLLQLLFVPGLADANTHSVPDFFQARYGGRAPRLAAAAVVAVSMLALLVAQLMAAGVAGARLLGLGLSTSIAAAAAALFVCFALKRIIGAAWLGALVFALMLAAILVPTVQLSAEWYANPVPQLAYANALAKTQELEETLLFDDLADPTYMRTLIRPFLSLSLMNFLGLVVGFAAGTAALAHVLSRHVMGTPEREARWGLVWALGLAALLLSAAVAAAAYFKVALLTLIAGRVEIANLPEWIFAYGRIGLVEVCGRAATDVATITAACAALPDASPVVRLQDLTLSPDMILLALPEIAGLGTPLMGLIAVAAIAAALVTAVGPLHAITSALTGARSERTGLVSCGIAGLVVVVGALAATTRPADILTVATWGFLLAAAGLFPALVAATWWRRASGPGVAAGMLAGLAVCLLYLAGTRYFAVAFYDTWTSLSSAGPMATEFFNEYKDAWLAAEPGAAKEAAWQVLDAQAQTMADWWGIKPVAATLLAMPAGIVALVVVSLLKLQRERG